jgi:hypothetical protein
VSGAAKALATLADYVQRSTQWQEGGATRHDALLALGELTDDVEWTEKGLAEWRDMWKGAARQNTAIRATASVAIGHLQTVLNKARTHAEQQAADTAARDWLTSIGSEPT